jgi:hypothetical protein
MCVQIYRSEEGKEGRKGRRPATTAEEKNKKEIGSRV